MYLRSLRVQNLKLLKDVSLDFCNADGSPRMWTVIIGKNGTGKTSLLYAAGLAGAGGLLVNALAQPVAGHLRDRRSDAALSVEAEFEIRTETPEQTHPWAGGFRGMEATRVRSIIEMRADEDGTIRQIEDRYISSRGEDTHHLPPWVPVNINFKPVENARARQAPGWRLIGYGVARVLPPSGYRPIDPNMHMMRMRPIFDHGATLTSIAFANYFEDQPAKLRLYTKTLKKVLFHPSIRLLPGLTNLELRGNGGVRRAADLLDRDRFEQQIGGQSHKIPAAALAHGYQSTIAWIADLVGHIVMESEGITSSEEMTALVLIDELDIYLHPSWQANIVGALRQIFPKVQFVVTTHSPLVLASARPEEIVLLEQDAASGDVRSADWPHEAATDARLMTTADLYQRYFGIPDIFSTSEGRALRDYHQFAHDPGRSDEEERILKQSIQILRDAGIKVKRPAGRRAA